MDLFGSDSDEEQPREEQPREEQPEAEEEPREAPTSAADKRKKMMELASRKRKEQEEAAEAEARAKGKAGKKARKERAAPAIDFGDSEDEEGDEDYRPAAEEGDGEGALAPGAVPDEGEEEERELLATEADRDFIDDTELAPEERADFGDEEQDAAIANAEEASEEDDELERLFNKSRRKSDRGRSEAERKKDVEDFLAKMEVAVEHDLRAFEAGQPAVHKLKMLQRVEEMLSTKSLHSELLDGGLLGVLKAWLEPLPDATLPNSKVRGSVLRLLGQLPVDCAQEDRKEQLKRSGLGRIVMFLFKVPDETPTNRRMAKELIERWSRPILAPRAGAMDAEEQQRILEARQARQQRLAAQEAAAQQPDGDNPEAAARTAPKPGEVGFRWHAAVPQAASLDYVRAPTSRYAMPDKKQGGGGKDKGQHKLTKKLDTLKKKGKVTGRAANVSVEGRNVTIQH